MPISKQNYRKLNRLIEIIPVIFPDYKMAEHYGEIRAILERSGSSWQTGYSVAPSFVIRVNAIALSPTGS